MSRAINIRVRARFRSPIEHFRILLAGKWQNQKNFKYQCSSQDVPFCWCSFYHVVTVSDQVGAKIDLITFLITTEPSPVKQTLEKVLQSDVSISLACCQVAAQVSVAMIISQCYSKALFLKVCMYSGSGDPYKAKRIDNRLHELGHAGQTNTGASRTGKPDGPSGSSLLIDIRTCSFYLVF